MSGKSLEVSINPEIIRWARESAGWSIEEISKKLKTSKENFEKIESGSKLPTFRQLELLAKYFKRPVSVFFLPEPPEEPSITASFRILPKSEEYLSKKLRLAIRKTRYYQSIANELMRNLGIDPKPNIFFESINQNPIIVARKERERLGISIDKQLGWRNAYYAFNKWRNAIERQNILVFQYKFSLKSARGFSLMDKEPPVIALNSDDNILARIFTLFHEYAHIILRLPEIYAGEEEINQNNLEVENWCNRFASEFLVPESVLKEDIDFQNFLRTRKISYDMLERLSKKYRVSKHAILTRIRSLNLISQSEYESGVRKLKEEFRLPKSKEFFIPPPRKCIQEKGRQFVSLIFQGKERKLITTADTIEYLSVKLKHLNKVEELAVR